MSATRIDGHCTDLALLGLAERLGGSEILRLDTGFDAKRRDRRDRRDRSDPCLPVAFG